MVSKMRSSRVRMCATASILAAFAAGASGCAMDGRQFREAALPMIETGTAAILNGILDGIFATIEVETPNP